MHKINVPYSKDAEDFLCGSILCWPEYLPGLDVDPEDFYNQRHRWLWEAFRALNQRGKGIDLFTVSEELKRLGRLDECGGLEWLGELGACVPFGHRPEDSAATVREKAQRRAVLRLAQEMAKAALDEKTDLTARAPEFIGQLANSYRVTGGAVHWSKYLDDLFSEIEERAADPREVWGIPTGFKVFDRVTGGLQLGESMVLSGKPGVGKSMLALQIAAQMAAHSPGAVYSLEMKGQAVMRRLVSAESQIQVRKLKSGRIDDGEWPLITEAIERLAALQVYMSDGTGWTTTSLRADLTRLKAAAGVKWFVFDYLLLANDGEGKDEIERSALISRNMKLLCRHLDLAGVLIHSMNKTGLVAVIPDQSSLRGSGQVPYDADLICFLNEFQPIEPSDNCISEKDRANMRTLFFGKGRELENPRKYIHMVKRPDYPVFGDYQAEPQNDNGRYV
jgi:replicative DNA helicase